MPDSRASGTADSGAHPRGSARVRIRVGQKYLESGADGTPTLARVEVASVDPLTVIRERWNGYDSHNPFPYPEAQLRALPLVHDPDLSAEELREALLGRTIVAVEVDEQEGDWPQGRGDTTLTLDNGQRVSFVSWGYDSNGMDAHIDPPLEVGDA